MTKFDLSKDQDEKLEEWQDSIKKIFGLYGDYEFRFRQNGIFCGVKVWSDLAKTEIDLTEYDKI